MTSWRKISCLFGCLAIIYKTHCIVLEVVSTPANRTSITHASRSAIVSFPLERRYSKKPALSSSSLVESRGLALRQQFQLTHGNFNLLTAFFTSPTICLSVSCGGRQWPPKVKTQNQESRFKVDLQSEKLQSKMKSRFTKTNASRH